MDKNELDISKNNIKIKTNSKNLSLKINQIYFSIEKIPYNKILHNILIFLQRRFNSRVFNEIYKYFIKELKRYLSLSSYKNLASNNLKNSNTKNQDSNKNNYEFKKPLITDFSINSFENEQDKNLIKTNKKSKKSKPLIGLSFSHKLGKLNSQKRINSSSFSNLNFNYLDINFLKKYSKIQNTNYSNINKNPLNKTINNSNSKEEKYFYYKNKKIFLNKNSNKFKINEKLDNRLNLKNNNFNTINTTIHKNEKIKKINNNLDKTSKEKRTQYISNVRKKISTNKTLGNLPHQTFTDIINSNPSNNKKITLIKNTKNCNLKNTVVINNTIFNKYKNNINIGLIEDDKKRLKIINIKLPKPKNQSDKEFLRQLQTSEEMLKKIKNSLDDENLRGMLNFSYENFLSKESERESKEYSIEE